MGFMMLQGINIKNNLTEDELEFSDEFDAWDYVEGFKADLRLTDELTGELLDITAVYVEDRRITSQSLDDLDVDDKALTIGDLYAMTQTTSSDFYED